MILGMILGMINLFVFHSLELGYPKGLSTALKSDGKAVIHTFYEYSVNGELTNAKVIDAWNRTWMARGWETKIVTLADAQRHPRFNELRDKLEKVPLGTKKHLQKYDLMCYLRYIAMAVIGGGWMSDFDTVPLNLPPTTILPNKGRFTCMDLHVPSLVSGSQAEFERMIELMINTALSHTEKHLFSDMHALNALRTNNNTNYVAQRNVAPGFPGFFVPRLKCASLRKMYGVHFSHSSLHKAKKKIKNRGDIMLEAIEKWNSQCVGGNSTLTS